MFDLTGATLAPAAAFGSEAETVAVAPDDTLLESLTITFAVIFLIALGAFFWKRRNRAARRAGLARLG